MIDVRKDKMINNCVIWIFIYMQDTIEAAEVQAKCPAGSLVSADNVEECTWCVAGSYHSGTSWYYLYLVLSIF